MERVADLNMVYLNRNLKKRQEKEEEKRDKKNKKYSYISKIDVNFSHAVMVCCWNYCNTGHITGTNLHLLHILKELHRIMQFALGLREMAFVHMIQKRFVSSYLDYIYKH